VSVHLKKSKEKRSCAGGRREQAPTERRKLPRKGENASEPQKKKDHRHAKKKWKKCRYSGKIAISDGEDWVGFCVGGREKGGLKERSCKRIRKVRRPRGKEGAPGGKNPSKGHGDVKEQEDWSETLSILSSQVEKSVRLRVRRAMEKRIGHSLGGKTKFAKERLKKEGYQGDRRYALQDILRPEKQSARSDVRTDTKRNAAQSCSLEEKKGRGYEKGNTDSEALENAIASSISAKTIKSIPNALRIE